MKQRQRLSPATLRHFFAGVVGAKASSQVTGAAAAPADELRKLLEPDKPDEAYRVAKTTPDELGNPAFNFYFGVAAVNRSKASEGALSMAKSGCDLSNFRRGHGAHSGCCGIQMPINTVHF